MSKIKNVIVVMADSLQYNYLGCYGNEWIKTPNFDRFALESTLFENCYAEANPTVPCRRSILTGCYTLPFAGWGPLRQEDTSVPDILWGTGIQTGLVYDAAPMRLPKYGFSRGFDYVKFTHGNELDEAHYTYDKLVGLNPDDFFEERAKTGIDPIIVNSMIQELANLLKHRQHWRSDEDTQVAMVMKSAIKYLEQEVDRTKPFFLWVDSFDPHEPWDPPSVYHPEMDYLYDPGYKGKNQINPIPGLVKGRYTEEDLHHIRMLYAEKITMVVKWVGKFLDRIRTLGLWENTLIILVSDHGEPLGNGEYGHGLMRKLRPWPYEELVHIPFLVRVPGIGEGKRVKSFTQSCDLGPTILDYILPKDEEPIEGGGFLLKNQLTGEDMTGKSLLPLVTGELEKVRDFAIAGYYGFSWSIITEDYSYIHWLANITDKFETTDMLQKVYDKAGIGLGEGTKGLQTEEMWTCTPHSEVIVPESDELFDRKKDLFQLNNIIDKNPEKAAELLKKLKLFMGELITC
jgi:arylsulfatase A-like enzyme